MGWLGDLRQKYREAVPLSTRRTVRGIGQATSGLSGLGTGVAYAKNMNYNYNPTNSAPATRQVYNGVDIPDTSDNQNVPSNSSSSGGGGGSVAAMEETPPQFNQMFQGNIYDDPSTYMNAVYSSAQQQYDQQKKQLENNYASGLISFADKARLMEQARANIQTKADNIVHEYQTQSTSLGEGRDTSIQGQRGYFSNISPDAYQSQQGTYENKVLNEYQRGLTELDRTKTQNEQILGQASENLAMEGRNTEQAKQDYLTEFQNKLSGLANSLQQQKDETYNNMQSNLAGTPYESQMSQVGGYTPENVNTQQFNINDMMGQIQALNLALNNMIGKKTPVSAKGAGATGTTQEKTLQDYLYANPVTA